MTPQPINLNEEHLRLLRIFHFVCAGLAAFFACLPVIHLVFGLVMLLAPDGFDDGGKRPPAFIGWFLVTFASFFILMGWTFAVLLAVAGRYLGRRKHYKFCLVMACVACIFVPFGTVLGVFTIVVLLRPGVRPMFEETGMEQPSA